MSSSTLGVHTKPEVEPARATTSGRSTTFVLTAGGAVASEIVPV